MTDIHFTGTLYYNYTICPRKAWLMYHQIEPEHDHDLLDQGRLNQEEHYKRDQKEWELPGIRVDQIHKDGDTLVLGEIKKSSAGLDASILQLTFYLLRLKEEGIAARGEVQIPKEREKVLVTLNEASLERLNDVTHRITLLVDQSKPPVAKWLQICPNCAYAEFCWSGDASEA